MVPTVERGLRDGGLLLDRDRRRQAADEVDVGLLHLPEELPRVGRQRLDVAALALGVERVERERRLAGAGHAGEDDELVARDVEVDVAEVVLARAADDDFVVEKAVCGHRDIKVDQPSSGRSVEQMFVRTRVQDGAVGRRSLCSDAARAHELEPGECLLLACRPHPAALLPALARAVVTVLATASVLALLARSSAPHAVHVSLDLLAVAFAARAALRFTRAVWQWDRALLALTSRRVFVVRPARRRAARVADDDARRPFTARA